ncbi:two-component system sensor histidine kinase RppB [Allocoleopsis sp.]|uniref:two-component system sensor histidine kinase RppB n=1 Tax=Allocoleopsis sp. TaxID=3088169 RepID=UPI002FD4ECD5
MNQDKLFAQTRWRLASGYALVMGFILSVCGLAVYEAIVHTHWQTLERELEAVAGTLHDSIETKLKQPGHLESTPQQLLPDPEPPSKRHVVGAIYQGNYYVRLLDGSRRTIAMAGLMPPGVSFPCSRCKGHTWDTLKDASGNRFHQVSLPLHSPNYAFWGYLQVGRSLQDLDDHLDRLKLILLLGLPIAMILVGGSSWWLAGLAMKPIYQSYRQIEQFTADAAHELRTPIAASQATVESALMMPDLSYQETQDILGTIDRQNQRLAQLVADLLLLARMDKKVVPTGLRLCCLNDIVNDSVEEFQALAMSTEIALTSMVPVGEPLNIVGVPEQLYRLVSNLIVNAIQYTSAGGSVTVVLDRSHLDALIHVQDTGIGIAPEERSRIFDRFYRVNSDRSRHTGGSGLGLAIAKAIVQAHQGSIQVQSELSKGSMFTIRLPLEVVPSKSDRSSFFTRLYRPSQPIRCLSQKPSKGKAIL